MKKDNSKIYTYITTAAAFLQMYLPNLLLNPHTSDIISAALLSIVSVFTIMKQRVSVEVNDKKAVWYTWLLVGIAGMGGINEIVGKIQFNGNTQNILRSAIAGIIGLLNIMSKSLFPTDAGKAIAATKNDIKSGTSQVLVNSK